jgi:hypothetical protein
MMGYKYADIQKFGTALNRAEFYLPPSDTETREGLTQVWDFFEGLLAEGYVEGEEQGNQPEVDDLIKSEEESNG